MILGRPKSSIRRFWLDEKKKANSMCLNIKKFTPFSKGSRIKLSEELSNCMKGFINIHDRDSECFG